MNLRTDEAVVSRLLAQQRGVLSKADLQTALAEPHPAAFVRRAAALERTGALRRFVRGWYVGAEFDLPTLSQRLAPDSTVSCHTVLARDLIIGARSERQLIATKTGRARTYRGLDHEIVHLHLAPHLDFGHRLIDGVRYALPEKAVLDVLYFHLRGRRQPFDLHSDLDLSRFDRALLERFLSRYRNPKFRVFAERILELS
jgi:hypothetical protein